MDTFDEELEAEIRKVDAGSERRRQVAVHELDSAPGVGVLGRVFLVSGGIAAALLLAWLVGTALGLDLLFGACEAVGIC